MNLTTVHSVLPRARRDEAKGEAKKDTETVRDRSGGKILVVSGSAVWLWAGENLVWRPFLCRGRGTSQT
jgi:hypothetical protein